MSNSLWNLHVVAVPEADSDFDTVTEWAAEEIETLRAKVAELEGERDRHKQNEQLQMERAIAAEAQLAALPKWAQSSESKGQFYRKSIQEMAALREQLTALQTAIDATGEVHPSWNTSKEFQEGWRECIAHIREDAGRPATYFARMRAELSELREGLEGLIKEWCSIGAVDDRGSAWYGNKLKPLLTQTTPTVNSAEAVDGGEDSGSGS